MPAGCLRAAHACLMVKLMAPVQDTPRLVSENVTCVRSKLKLHHEAMTDTTEYLRRSWPCTFDLDHKVTTWLGRSVSSSCIGTGASEAVASPNCCNQRSRHGATKKQPRTHLVLDLLGTSAISPSPGNLTVDVRQNVSPNRSLQYSPLSTSSHISSDSAMDISNQFSDDERSNIDTMTTDFAASDINLSRDLTHDLKDSAASLQGSDFNLPEGMRKLTALSSGDRLEALLGTPPAVVISDHSFDYPWSPDLFSDLESGGDDMLSLSFDVNNSSMDEEARQRKLSLASSHGSESSMKSVLSDCSSLSFDDEASDVSTYFFLLHV